MNTTTKKDKMNTIYHYSAKNGLNKRGADQAKAEGVLKTEMKLGSGDNDQFNMDYVWFTESNTIPGACHNTALGITYALCDALQGNPILPADAESIMDDEPITFVRWGFDADKIGAKKWQLARNKWAGISPSKKKFVREIDLKSTWNGDDVLQYWVTEQDVSLNDAVSCEEITTTKREIIQSLGYKSVQELYTQGCQFVLKHAGAWMRKVA